jgi:tetratricopeptide (TPR) repeat protein
VALEAAVDVADLAGQAHTHHGLSLALGRSGRYRQAAEHTRGSLGADIGDVAAQAKCHLNLCLLPQWRDRDEDCLTHAEQALALFRTIDDPMGTARALSILGWTQARLGDYPQAIENCRHSLTMHERLDDVYGQANTWDSLAMAHQRLGQFEQAARR